MMGAMSHAWDRESVTSVTAPCIIWNEHPAIHVCPAWPASLRPGYLELGHQEQRAAMLLERVSDKAKVATRSGPEQGHCMFVAHTPHRQ
jgi:hypothetical protein